MIETPTNLLEIIQHAKARNMSDGEVETAYLQYLLQKARDKGVPLAGILELTPLCNLSCKMCYVHLQPDQMGNRSLLRFEQWKEIIDQAYEKGMIRVTLTGGECLTYPEFDKLYLYLQSLGIRATILTNGLLLTEERIRFFKEYPTNCIQVTMYGHNDNEYERVCGVRCFELISKNIEKAWKAGLKLHIAITPNRFLDDGGIR